MLNYPSRALARMLLVLTALTPLSFAAQEEEQDTFGDAQLVVEPESLALEIGETATLAARVVDGDGETLDITLFFFSRSRRGVSVDSDGNVEALTSGSHSIVVRTPRRTGRRLSVTVPVEVAFPPVASVEFIDLPERVYTGTSISLSSRVVDVNGDMRPGADVRYSSSVESVASIDSFGNLVAHRPGQIVALVEAGEHRQARNITVYENPTTRIELTSSADDVRTGDVIRLMAMPIDGEGNELADVPVQYAFLANPDDTLGNAATGQIEQDGRFVAESPGRYTILATSGSVTARKTIRAGERDVRRRLDVIGHGEVFDTHTSDLWIWEGLDGRDYAVTGTWGANGEAHFWDVTDPTDLKRISTVKVDARTVNDVKVSPDGRICVISREGASNRRNGFVVYDVSDPSNPIELSTFDEELTGGVHNVFIDGDYVYALSAGRRYDIIRISDPKKPFRVGSYELETPGHSIHDVWVENGLAYSSNWRDGVHIVDVGNGMRGGTPEKPVPVSSYAYPSGWNHAAFPFTSQSTGRFYVVAGDESFPYGLSTEDNPTYPRGWLHFIDFTDVMNPVEIARYQVPEAGTHNLWIENDICYVAFYNGGVRVVDVSGELLGDLYNQGREIAHFRPTHKEGYVPNAPMVWGPQPHKGHLFLSDWNSGLWALKLGAKETRPR